MWTGRGDRGRKNSRRHGTGTSRLEHEGDFTVSRSPQDASQLLGFRYREEVPAHPAGQGGHGRGGGSRRNRGRPAHHRPAPARRPFKKENFLQASYRFVVSDAVDVGKHETDPDAMFDWDDVLQVLPLPASTPA